MWKRSKTNPLGWRHCPISPKLTNTTRLIALGLGVLVSFDFLLAHPHGPDDLITHEHPALGLIVGIEDDRVVYDISLANGFLNTVVPQERGFLKIHLEEDTFVFENPAQQQRERDSLEAFAKTLPPVEVNGTQVAPQFESFQFVRSSASAIKAESDRLPPDARVRVVFPTPEAPKQVALTWDIFANAYSVDAFGRTVKPSLAARLDTRDQSRIITFSDTEPTVVWEATTAGPASNAIKFADTSDGVRFIPVLSIAIGLLGLLGLGLCKRANRPRLTGGIVLLVTVLAVFLLRGTGKVALPPAGVAADKVSFDHVAPNIFKALLSNVYRAFEYRSESDVYDVLAQSVDGPLLDTVYKEIYDGLIIPDQAGAVTKVKSVDILEATLVDPNQPNNSQFEITGRWQVDGMVYHWGHVHDTSSIFEAIYTVAPRDGFWKIIKTEMKTATPET